MAVSQHCQSASKIGRMLACRAESSRAATPVGDPGRLLPPAAELLSLSACCGWLCTKAWACRLVLDTLPASKVKVRQQRQQRAELAELVHRSLECKLKSRPYSTEVLAEQDYEHGHYALLLDSLLTAGAHPLAWRILTCQKRCWPLGCCWLPAQSHPTVCGCWRASALAAAPCCTQEHSGQL